MSGNEKAPSVPVVADSPSTVTVTPSSGAPSGKAEVSEPASVTVPLTVNVSAAGGASVWEHPARTRPANTSGNSSLLNTVMIFTDPFLAGAGHKGSRQLRDDTAGARASALCSCQ